MNRPEIGLSRRDLLKRTGTGLPMLALAAMEAAGEGADVAVNPLAPKRPHFEDNTQPIFQFCDSRRLGNQAARLQLRVESLPRRSCQRGQGVWGDAPLHPGTRQAGRLQEHR